MYAAHVRGRTRSASETTVRDLWPSGRCGSRAEKVGRLGRRRHGNGERAPRRQTGPEKRPTWTRAQGPGPDRVSARASASVVRARGLLDADARRRLRLPFPRCRRRERGRARGAGGLLSLGRAFSEIDNGWSLQRVQAVRTRGRRDGGETGRAGAATGRPRIIGSASCLPVGRSGRSFAVPDCLTATGGPGETWSDSLCEGLDRARGGSRPVPFPGLNTMRGPRPVRDRPV